MPTHYMARIADGVLVEAPTTGGAVQVKGSKWCDKTATSLQQATSVVYLQDPDHSASYLTPTDIKFSTLLEGRAPRLVDEWQMAPQLWDTVCLAVDLRGEPGQLVLTGSSTPAVGGTYSSVGRTVPIVMRTMTLFEPEDPSGQISSQRLFDGEKEIAGVAPLDIGNIARALCCGGWPAAVTAGIMSVPGRLTWTYVEGLIDFDVARMDGISWNSTRMYVLMRVYVRRIFIQASQTTATANLAVNDGTMALNTVSDYLDALPRAYATGNLPAWNPALRSKTAIRTSPTRQLVGPSIGIAAMCRTPADLLRDLGALGLQFESLCVRDLRIHVEAIDRTLLHYRDKTGLEADTVIVLVGGRWAPIGVKLGSRQLDEAVTHLRLLRERMDANRMGKPSFLAVITAGAAVYRRNDGVLTVPLACLRP